MRRHLTRGQVEAKLRRFGQERQIAQPVHGSRREGDEMVCRCGRRWPVGEDHP